ncbi:uncharacterized protein FOMMEDRAFT_146559 [Fomitiporia mediterranea MF3/22]|uniref:uncharacterized protein n=1 Tax=Fomitiporia mediterranea (strain MF3/22) TaxID=694068 RepID=UPI0004409185|nr:uncharacterized protein FOMMEDRAFT_146559 [Fomitiporia mediterranea MF3/22]EJD02681.1 hypothetical protein FOMMEDRAFT_146559 [Fomitiporia mediterranea MF3/22]
MAPRQKQQQKRRRANCQICEEVESKYACPGCEVLYCSVACYKRHKGSSCSANSNATSAAGNGNAIETPAQVESSPHNDDGPKSASNTLESVPRLLASDEGDASGSVSASRESAVPGSMAHGSMAHRSTAQMRQGTDSDLLGRLDVGGSRTEAIMDEDVEAGRVSTEVDGKVGDVEKEEVGQSMDICEANAAPDTSIAPNLNSPKTSSESTKLDSSHVNPRPPTPTPTSSQSQPQPNEPPSPDLDSEPISSNRPLRKLSSLKWPYIPDTSSYPDPLERDDPKPLSLAQYEAIARSPAIRRTLSAHQSLPTLLQKLDALRGPPRERALERVLGVAPGQASFSLSLPANSSSMPAYPTSPASMTNRREGEGEAGIETNEDDMRALRELAQAVEAAVRSVPSANGDFQSTTSTSSLLGLDWESMET